MKLVLLPGLDGTGKLFAEFLKVLPSSFIPDVLRYPPDRERSYSDLQLELHSAISQPEPYVILAESFSTPIAVRFAASSPPNLRALVICAGFIAPPISGLLRDLASLFLAPSLLRIALSNSIVKHLLLGNFGSAACLENVRIAISSVSPRVLLHRVRSVLTCDEHVALGNVSVPILYIRPAKDRLVRESSVETIHKIKPGMSIVRINGPHLILQTKPQEVADALVGFNRQLP